MANVHSPIFRPFARDERSLAAVVQRVIATAPKGLVVPELPAGCAGEIAGAARGSRRIVLDRVERIARIVQLDGEFADYLGRFRRRYRSDCERRRRRLAELGAVFDVLVDPHDLDSQLDQMFALEAAGWKGRHGTAIAALAETSAFYREVAHAFAREGALKLSTITVDGRLIAFDIALVDGDRIWVLKGSYDEAYRNYGPGLLLTLAEIQRGYELGLDALELLGDDAQWKTRFANAARAVHRVDAYSRGPFALADYGYRRHLRPRLRRLSHALVPSRRRG